MILLSSITGKFLDNAVSNVQIPKTIPDDIIQLIKRARNPSFLLKETFGWKRWKCFIWCYNGIAWWCGGLWVCVEVFTYLENYQTSYIRKSSAYIDLAGCLLLQTDLNVIVWEKMWLLFSRMKDQRSLSTQIPPWTS